jgi:hypothetical protein
MKPAGMNLLSAGCARTRGRRRRLYVERKRNRRGRCIRVYRRLYRGRGRGANRELVFYVGIGPALGVASPISIAPPYVYRPLVWGGLWGIPLAFILRSLNSHHMAVGFLYFLAPVAALLLVFLPLGGMGLFGLKGGPGIMVHAIIVNSPYGIVTTLAIAALSGQGWSSG